MDRAVASGATGREFESLRAHQFHPSNTASIRPHPCPREIVEMKILRALDRAHILSALESRGICGSQLTHAALHLTDRFVFVIGHPLLQLSFDEAQMFWSLSQQHGAHHGDIGADHKHLDYIFRPVNPAEWTWRPVLRYWSTPRYRAPARSR